MCRFSYGICEGATLKERAVDGLPHAAQLGETQNQDRLAALQLPRHSRFLEALREDRLASGFRHAATDRKTLAAILAVVHPPLVCVEVVVGPLVKDVYKRQVRAVRNGRKTFGNTRDRHSGDVRLGCVSRLRLQLSGGAVRY